jgi:uncharacterized protein involved in exopolysaccharide biosynthesis/Mrp family chromosome partitioning ATPase
MPAKESPKTMKKPPVTDTPKGFGPQDIIFMLLKHKWMILILTFVGLGAAAVVHKKQVPIYQSTAKLLVRYVMETGATDAFSDMKRPGNSPSRKGDPVMLTEIEILNSVDLSKKVAEEIGLEKLIPGLGEVTDENRAQVLASGAGAILSKLEVWPGDSPNVLHLIYSNTDQKIVKAVLDELVEQYFQKHLDIHRSVAAFDVVTKQTEEVRARLEQTERELNRLKTDSGLTSLAAATDALTAQRTRTQENLMSARAEEAEQEARIKSYADALNIDDASSPENGATDKPAVDPATRIPAQVITEFRAIMDMLAILQKRDLDLRVKFTDANRLVAQNQRQINDYLERRRSLSASYPSLTQESVATVEQTGNTAYNLDIEKARLASIKAKIQVFNEHLAEISALFSEQYAIGAQIDAMERKRQMEEAEFRLLESKLKEAKLVKDLDTKSMPNILVIQDPTEPAKSLDPLTQKIILGLAGGGLALGLGLAFLIEMLFNRKIERPTEIQTRLQLPLLLSIPLARRSERGGPLLGGSKRDTKRIGDSEAEWAATKGGEELALASQSEKADHFILPYSETIRDRIIFNFEVNNVIHKPKLLAVTGLSDGAGTSTIAAGLAKSFSEIRGVKVLLVDLSSFHPQESPLFGEMPRHSLTNALRLAQGADFRERPQNLYYANAPSRRDESGLSKFTPLQLHEMMPLLHASEYDYIIFDMPPVDQTSRTLTMAGLMDKVLLVLDAQNTSREALKWGYSELTKGRADVSCIFNKTRSHGPEWLLGAQ